MFTQTRVRLPGVRRWRWRVLLTVALVLFAWVGIGVAAPTSKSTVLDLRQLIQIAQRDNKDLQAARYAIEVARARLLQAGLRSNPRLELSAQSDFLFNNEGEYAGVVGVSQEFPVAGRLSRQKDLARVDIALAEAEVANAERHLADELAGKVYRLVIIELQVAALETMIGTDEALAKTTRARFRVAEVSEMDVNTVQLELQRLRMERALLQSERQTLTVSINALLGRPAMTPLTVTESLPRLDVLPGLQQVQSSALQARPDFIGALLSVDRAAAERALAHSVHWQDWTVGLQLAQDKQVIPGLPSQGTDRAIGLSLSIPLPLFNKSQGLLAEAEANRGQATTHVEALRLTILAEVASAHAEAARLQAVLAQYKQSALPIGERNVRLARQGYSMGLIPVFDVVQAQRQLAEANKTYLNTLDQYLQTLVRLHTAAGDYLAASAEPTSSSKD